MNKIIPFNKNIKFSNPIGEITSIALDDTLKFLDSYTISGDLIVRGCHKYDDIEEDFSYPLPTQIALDNKYDTSKAKITIDDFYYEIINDNTLNVKIDLLLDDLFYKEENLSRVEPDEKIENVEVIEDSQEKIENDDKETMNDIKEYSVYRVYLVGENDTLDNIIDKFKITKEDLSYYNDLEMIKPGMKLIIPSIDE